MINLVDVTAGYEGIPVIQHLNLCIRPGEMVALLGRNGMGKTTLLRTIAGHLPPIAGRVEIGDAVMPAQRPEAAARAGLSFLPDDRGVFPTLTVAENMDLARRGDHQPPLDFNDIFPVLRDRTAVRAGNLSGGQKQQLGIARAMVAGSRAIVIDEFSQGLQPSITHDVLKSLRDLAASGICVLLVDQKPDPLVQYATRILAMSKGRLVLDQPAESVLADRAALEAFLVV